MKQRVELPSELAARVMFASDRTCCICRLEKQHVQIHHIDENPSNNDFDNLAVICLHCHSDAHIVGAFVRSLSPELIRLYNSSWREIAKSRLEPSRVPNIVERELTSEALLEISLDCHYWRNLFMGLRGQYPKGDKVGENIWDALEKRAIPDYTDEAYRHYLPLFVTGINELMGKFDRLSLLFIDVLPLAFRARMMRTQRRLEVERDTYINMPRIFELTGTNSTMSRQSFFGARFEAIFRVLRETDIEAKRLSETLFPSSE